MKKWTWLLLAILGTADVFAAGAAGAAGIDGSAGATSKMSGLGITQLKKEMLSAGKGSVLRGIDAKGQVAFEIRAEPSRTVVRRFSYAAGKRQVVDDLVLSDSGKVEKIQSADEPAFRNWLNQFAQTLLPTEEEQRALEKRKALLTIDCSDKCGLTYMACFFASAASANPFAVAWCLSDMINCTDNCRAATTNYNHPPKLCPKNGYCCERNLGDNNKCDVCAPSPDRCP